MRRYFVATEIDLSDSKHLCYHEFEASDYRSITSLNAFFWGMKKYNYSKTRLYYGNRKNEWIADMRRQNASSCLPTVIIHSSIWDFYEFIVYDYKKKKHLSDMGG